MTNMDVIEQQNINKLVDTFLKIAINYIKSIIKLEIPDINDTFDLILGIKLYLNTYNGILKYFPTLRTKDVITSNMGRTQIVQAVFKLSTIKFQYDCKCEIIFMIFTNVVVLGTVDGVTISVKLIIDYDKECGINLDVEVTEFGQCNLKVTGFGPFNGLLSDYVTKQAQDKIVKKVKVEARNTAKKLSEYIRKIYNNEIYSK